jgi:hypothetical protein
VPAILLAGLTQTPAFFADTPHGKVARSIETMGRREKKARAMPGPS